MKLSKIIAITLFALATAGQVHSQILGGALGKKGKDSKSAKNYEPVFEIEGKTPPNPSKLSMQDKYAGKIVFSDQRLKQDNTAENLFKSSFTLGESVYARVFTTNAVENYMLYDSKYGQTKEGEVANMRYSYTIYYYIDDVEVLAWKQGNRDDALRGTNTWQRTVLLPTSKEKYDLGVGDKARDILNNLSVGTHKVKVVVWAGEGKELASIKPIAEGEFDLNVKVGSGVKIGTKWSDIKNGDLAKDPKVGPKLTKLYSEYLKEKYPEYTFKEIKITADGYNIKKAESGLPKYRSVTTSAYLVDPKSGKCYNYFHGYYQNYAGAGTYSDQFIIYEGSPEKIELDCE